MPLTEADIEQIALDWFAECGYTCVHGPDIAPDMPASERASYQEVLLVDRLRAALQRCNPGLRSGDIEEVVRRLQRSTCPPDTPQPFLGHYESR